MKRFHIENDDISDGDHTFGELYAHRHALFVRLCLMQPEKCAWKEDADTPGWILLYCELDDGQISYHVPSRFKKQLEGNIKHDPTYKWDGHDSNEVLNRLERV